MPSSGQKSFCEIGEFYRLPETSISTSSTSLGMRTDFARRARLVFPTAGSAGIRLKYYVEAEAGRLRHEP